MDIVNRPMLYFSAVQTPVTDMSVIVKTSQAMDRLPEIVQDIFAKVDSGQPVYDIAPLATRVDRSLSTRRFVVLLLLLGAAVGSLGAISASRYLSSEFYGVRIGDPITHGYR